MTACLENPRATHKNKIGTMTTKLIRTTKKLTEEIREINSRTKPVRMRRKKSSDRVWTSWSGPGLLNARATDRLSSIK